MFIFGHEVGILEALVFRKYVFLQNGIQSNLGHADKSKIVIDPFVGSGSLLVGAAYYGAYVMGADLDYKLVNAIGKTITKIKVH